MGAKWTIIGNPVLIHMDHASSRRKLAALGYA